MSRTSESIPAMRASIAAFNAEFENAHPTPAQLNEAAGAYNGLGDQLGLPGVASLGDSSGSLDAYRRAIDLSRHALQLSPSFTRSSRTLAIDFAKMGDIVVQTDPAEAQVSYRQSLDAWSALIAGGDSSGTSKRGLARVYMKLGAALSASRDYTGAIAAFDQAAPTLHRYAAADPKDIRAATDLFAVEENEAQTEFDMLDTTLNPAVVDRAKHAQHAIELLRESAALIAKLLLVDPANRIWVTNLAYDNVTLGTLEVRFGDAKNGAQHSAQGIAELSKRAFADNASMDELELATTAMLRVLPQRLRNPRQTVQCAERLVALDHRRTPGFLVLLAQAYGQDGQPDKAAGAAKEGLSLLPPQSPTAAVTRTRQLLDLLSRG
jgi:tetratricopeptide (TPR) repeat protein